MAGPSPHRAMRFMPDSAGRGYHATVNAPTLLASPAHGCPALRPGQTGWPVRGLAVAVAVVLLALAGPLAWADGGGDQRRARQAMLAGEIRPLGQILQQVQPQLGGEVIATELEREHGRWVYEFKVLQPDGRIVEWSVDARDGRVLKSELKKGKR